MLDLIESFAEPIRILRAGPTDVDSEGNVIKAKRKEIAIMAAVQPFSIGEMENLPEGERTKQMIKLYTSDALKLSQNESLKASDVVLYNGQCWEVQRTEQWPDGLGHYKSVAVLIQPKDLERGT